MRILLASIGLIFAHTAIAQSNCIPRTFAEEDVVASYDKLNEEKRAELAGVQKEYVELAEQVRSKKSRDNKIELTNAFVDAAAMAYLIHAGLKAFELRTIVSILAVSKPGEVMRAVGYSDDPVEFKNNLRRFVRGLDDQKKSLLRKQLGKKYEDKVVNKFNDATNFIERLVDFGEEADDKGIGKTFKAKLKEHFNIPKRFKGWIESMKDITFGEKMKKAVFTAGKKIGFASVVLVVPLGIYVNIAKIKEQQRLVELTAEQDKVMKQALLLELFLSQKSFAELAATRAQLHPNKVCPPTT